MTDDELRARSRPCKLGTMPVTVIVDGRTKVAVGNKIRWREAKHGTKWATAVVTKVLDDGYFFAERM